MKTKKSTAATGQPFGPSQDYVDAIDSKLFEKTKWFAERAAKLTRWERQKRRSEDRAAR